MAAHIAIWNSSEALGNRRLQAVVIDDGETTVVLGDSDLAEDLRDGIDLLDVGSPKERLAQLVGQMTYFTLDGPVSFDGRTSDIVDPIRSLYGL